MSPLLPSPLNFRLKRPDGDIVGRVDGEGPLVVFLHGWGLDHRMWRPQADHLKNRYRVLQLDRRGAGGSTAPPDAERELEDLDAIVSEFGGDQISLVGMSQGGRVALRYAYVRPEAVGRLVLTGAPVDGAPFAPEIPIPIESMRAAVMTGRREDASVIWHAHPLMDAGPNGDATPLLEAMKSCRWEELLDPRALAPFPVNIFAHLVEVRTLTHFIYGALDQTDLLTVAQKAAEVMPSAILRFIPDAGHLLNWTHPQEFNEALSEALAS